MPLKELEPPTCREDEATLGIELQLRRSLQIRIAGKRQCARFTTRRIIADALEIEAFRRRNGTACRAFPLIKSIANILRVPGARAHALQRAHDAAHLVLQKASRLGEDLDAAAFMDDIQPIQRADRRVRLAVCGAECREIMAANEYRSRLPHRIRIQVPATVPHQPALDGKRGPAHRNSVAVAALDSVEAGVEIVGRSLSMQYGCRGLSTAGC